MSSRPHHSGTVRALLSAIAAVYLWTGIALVASAQDSPRASVGVRWGSERTASHPLAEVMQSPRTRLRLTRMENVGSPSANSSFVVNEPLTDREQLAFTDAAHALLDRLTRSGGRFSALFRTAHSAARLVDAPNRALRRLTGADRAHLNIRRRRVSFTWLVSW
jgi:hypothetical protein